MEKYVIKITTSNNTPCYLSNMDGDPGRTRTISLNFAKLFDHEKVAESNRDRLLKLYPNREFIVQPVGVNITEIPF